MISSANKKYEMFACYAIFLYISLNIYALWIDEQTFVWAIRLGSVF